MIDKKDSSHTDTEFFRISKERGDKISLNPKLEPLRHMIFNLEKISTLLVFPAKKYITLHTQRQFCCWPPLSLDIPACLNDVDSSFLDGVCSKICSTDRHG